MQFIDNIPVWGDPDPASVAQMQRCIQTAASGALMADHHKGYSQPIGGVVVYDNAISPSGVGYDIGCFAGETRIFTLDGKHPTLAEVAGQDVFVLASHPDGRVVPAKGHSKLTRRKAQVVRVTLDSGCEITCTPDHQFMMRDGSYKRADQLDTGLSLMPLYWTSDKDGYVLVRNNKMRRLVRLHWLAFHNGMTMPAPEIPEGDELVIHHRDFNRVNNVPSNLEPMGKIAHDDLHSMLKDRSHIGTADFEEHRLQGIEDFWTQARSDDGLMEKRRQSARINGAKVTAESVQGNGQRGAVYLRQFNSDPHRRRATYHPVDCPLCGQGFNAPQALGYHARKAHPEVRLKTWRPGRSTREQLALAANNHKVVSVEAVAEPMDVYCLEVPGLNNFGLLDGVFVHNCGNKAVRTNLRVDDVLPDIEPIMDQIYRDVAFGVGRKRAEAQDHALFDDPAWDDVPALRGLEKLAREQLGTVGSGNHYVDLFVDETGDVWVGVHFGSRGFGHKTASGFLNLAAGRKFDDRAPGESMDQPPTVLKLGTELGDSYFQAMNLAGRYAYAGRDSVVYQVLTILGAYAVDVVHNHHNFAWKEDVDGNEMVVVRKGATPNAPGQISFVGGSMGDNAVIIQGIGTDENELALYSTVHGAGRVMSRTEAAGKLNYKTRQRQGGKITHDMMNDWVTKAGVVLRGAGTDESPHVYKRLPDVLKAHENTIIVLHTLKPIGVAMAGEDVVDPYKD